MFFSRRESRGPDLHLDWKVRIFFLGALIAFIGMALNSRTLVLVAIGVLVAGIFLRFLPRMHKVGRDPIGDDPYRYDRWEDDAQEGDPPGVDPPEGYPTE